MPFAFRCPLYPIVGDVPADRSPIELAEAVLSAGAPLLQLRLKHTSTREFVELARVLRSRCSRHRAIFIVNDRCDVAKLVGADGVHLGQDDLAPLQAREVIGPDCIIGYSTHNREQLDQAVTDPAVDYVAYGPIFGTTSKDNPDPVRGLDRLAEAARSCQRPLVAIGGIDLGNIADVIAAGADAAAVIGAIASADDAKHATRGLLSAATGIG